MATLAEVKRYMKGKNKDGSTVRTPVIPEIAKAYTADPRTQLAVQSMATGSSTAPVAQGQYAMADAAARALQGALGGYANRQQENQYVRGPGGENDLLALRKARGQDGMTGLSTGAPPASGAQIANQVAATPGVTRGGLGGQFEQVASALTGQGPPGPAQGAPGPMPAMGGTPGGGQSPFPVTRPSAGPGSPASSGASGTLFDLSQGANALKAQGASVTSGYRTPAHNVQVGGVSNSFHTKGTPDSPQAYDFTPKPGQTMAQLEALARQEFPGYDVINEKNHVHVEPSKAMVAQMASRPDGGTPPPPAPPLDAFSPPHPQPVPDLPPAMARPTAPQAVAATKSPLLQAAYRIMMDGNAYESSMGQDMYAKGLTEQGTLNESAAERDQALRNAGYQNDLDIYSNDIKSRQDAAEAARTATVAENNKQQDSYVDWQRKMADDAAERKNRIEVAQIQAANRVDVAGMKAPKPLPANALGKLNTQAEGLDAIDWLNSNFRDQFVGKWLGNADVATNNVVGHNNPMSAWWQQYSQWTSDVIHGKYGSNFTKGEQDRFRQYSVTPRTAASVARQNIAKQQEILSTALARFAVPLSMQYDPEVVQAAVGRDLGSMGTAAPSGGAAPGGWGTATVVGK